MVTTGEWCAPGRFSPHWHQFGPNSERKLFPPLGDELQQSKCFHDSIDHQTRNATMAATACQQIEVALEAIRSGRHTIICDGTSQNLRAATLSKIARVIGVDVAQLSQLAETRSKKVNRLGSEAMKDDH
jgi:hypothetical protein